MSKRVAVLMGGISSEREVSLLSGAAVTEALNSRGYEVLSIDVGKDLGPVITALDPPPYAVFNALHGRYGEDGCFQGFLELLSIPYTHSGVLASAIAMDKPTAKRHFENAGIPCAQHVITTREEVLSRDVIDRPYVIKPLNEGSSVGVQIIKQGSTRPFMTDARWPLGDKVMVEKFVAGREITVAVMGDRALGVTELRTDEGFFDYDAKYTEGRTKHIVPARLPQTIYVAAKEYAVAAHRILGCRGVTRADFRYDDTQSDPGELIMLEINTQPGLTPLSIVPEQAAHAGIDFGDLVSWMVENAACEK
ncbi:MAG: D-alanine--D-alanine ligase [Rhodospirillaceae bacterium]|nr:D-alanine--D-alanine ligase [Rhodospirillaceae bacterium]